MIALSELQNSEWLATEKIASGQALLKNREMISIDLAMSGQWYLADIIAINDAASPFSTDDSVVYYSENKIASVMHCMPVNILYPTFDEIDVKSMLLTAFAHLILLKTQQTLGSSCYILADEPFRQFLVKQAQSMGFLINSNTEKPVDSVIIAKEILIAEDYAIVHSCRHQATCVVLNTSNVDTEQLVRSNKQLIIHKFVLDEIVSTAYWHAESTAYMRMNFRRALYSQQKCDMKHSLNSSEVFDSANKINVALIGFNTGLQKHLTTVTSELPKVKVSGVLPLFDVTENINTKNHLIFSDAQSLVSSDNQLIIVDEKSPYDIKELSQLLTHKKHLLLKTISKSNSLGLQTLLTSAQTNNVMLLPYVPAIASPFVTNILNDLHRRVEPISITIKTSDNDSALGTWILFCVFIVKDFLHDISIEYSADNTLVRCVFEDQSFVAMWFINQKKSETYFEVACQENSWQVSNWRNFNAYVNNRKFCKKTANFQTGEIQFLKNTFEHVLLGKAPDYYPYWERLIKSAKLLDRILK